MDFFNQTGRMAIGSRLRMLSDKITEDASQIYKLYGVDLKAKWFPVFLFYQTKRQRQLPLLQKRLVIPILR